MFLQVLPTKSQNPLLEDICGQPDAADCSTRSSLPERAARGKLRFIRGFAFFLLLPVASCIYATAVGLFFGFWMKSVGVGIAHI